MMNKQSSIDAGLLTTALRWIAGWTYFSAFWRRLVLENKLNPDEAGYIGEKFNHFLPQALGIKPLIEHLVSTPDQLWWAMVVFTLVEGVVGLFFMLGIFTRLMAIGVFLLAFGILLGSGWLGTTCLDEWQIGILGVASGFTIFLSGGGYYSLDAYLMRRKLPFTKAAWFRFLGSGHLPLKQINLRHMVLAGALLLLSLSLFTNQYFHGGVWGKLHNLSVRPHVRITDVTLRNEQLSFTVFRDEGADVYGSFLIGIQLLDQDGQVVFEQNQAQLSLMGEKQIENDYVARVKAGKHSLILPLGARARLHFQDPALSGIKGEYRLKLLDISGAEWYATLNQL